MIGASTCDKPRDDLCLRRRKLTNTSDDISRSIASAMSQVAQRAVDQALSIDPCQIVAFDVLVLACRLKFASNTFLPALGLSNSELVVEMKVALEERVALVVIWRHDRAWSTALWTT